MSLDPSLCATAPTVPEFCLCFLANTLAVSISSVISIYCKPSNCYSATDMPITKASFLVCSSPLPMYSASPANLLILLAYTSTDSPVHLTFLSFSKASKGLSVNAFFNLNSIIFSSSWSFSLISKWKASTLLSRKSERKLARSGISWSLATSFSFFSYTTRSPLPLNGLIIFLATLSIFMLK